MSSRVVEFTSLGSVGEVGASAHLIHIGGLKLLLDCGMHPKNEGKAALPDFSILSGAPDAVIVSHAHVDHCGTLPYLLKMFPGVLPFATVPSKRIIDRMLHNSVTVMGKIREEQGIEEYPLYRHEDVDSAMRRLYGVDMNQPFGIQPDSPVRVEFTHAGHVLGSACVRITSPDHTIFYTSDICTVDQELMRSYQPPDEPEAIDTLIVESTYGANEAADAIDYMDEAERFAGALRRVLDRGGVALVPSFALGRAQEVMNIVRRYQLQGAIPDVPVYTSGMGRAIYEIYRSFPDELKRNADLRPLDEFEAAGDLWDPAVVREILGGPAIVVATSGMMIENTPSAMIAEQLVQDEKHAVFFVGYCAPDTLGERMRTAKPGDELIFTRGGRPVVSRLKDIDWFHFSAHAHRKGLEQVIDSIPARNVIFVHGDAPAIEWMYHNTGSGRTKFAPRIGETVRLDGE